MPHHPCGRCEIEESIMGSDVAVKDVFFLVLDEGSEGGMDDAFWFAGCTGAVENVDWMGWREESELILDDIVVCSG